MSFRLPPPAGRSAFPPAGHAVRWAVSRDGAPPLVLAPYLPAAPAVVAAVVSVLGLRSSDRFVDLGCGDGRLLVAAAPRVALALGVELDPRLVLRARAAAAPFGRRVRVLHEPVGWTAPCGMTAGFANLLPGAAVPVVDWLRAAAPAGFRLALPAGSGAALAPAALRGAVVGAVSVPAAGGGPLGRIVVRVLG